MSITAKMPLLVLLAFALNAALLVGYYTFVLSPAISTTYSNTQALLDARASGIAEMLAAGSRETSVLGFADELTGIAQKENLFISLKNVSGDVVFATKEIEGINLNLSGTALVNAGSGVFFLKITQPLPLDDLPSIEFAREIMIAESVIVLFILISHTVFVHYNHVNPIIRLRQDVDNYGKGVKPQPTKRRDEIGWLKNRFVELTTVLDEERRKQNRIIASISHDIKTPLTSVMGYAERLKKGNLPPDRIADYVDIIYAKSLAIKEIIDEFDEYLGYNMESSLKLQHTTAGQICRTVREEFTDELAGMGADLIVECDCPDLWLEVDQPKLRRVFGNIIVNAVRYAKKPGLNIEISCRVHENSVLFSVSDNGVGVDDADLPRIFEPLYTSDESRSVSGLGLSICKSVVERHGGKIWAEHSQPSGLTILFTLGEHLIEPLVEFSPNG